MRCANKSLVAGRRRCSVVAIDGLGTSSRSKAFSEEVSFQNNTSKMEDFWTEGHV